MGFYEILDQVVDLLRRRGRVTYRALKREFQVDEAFLEDLKAELITAQRLAIDEQGEVLVWAGAAGTPPALQDDVHPQLGAFPALERRHPEAERRQLTVLFCDLVDSTSLARQLDPEELREVVQAYQDTCVKVIARFDGHIAQYLGDGLLVYFGYPLAHEDEAQRAVRAGLGMIEAVGQLNTRLAQERGVQMAVRLGIHTGLVVVGDIGSGTHQEQLALGETPIIAYRLQDLATPNTLVISAATFQLLGGFFACQPLGTPLLKGLTQPLAVYRVLYESMARSRLEAAGSTGLTPLVGREQDIELLRERWAQVKDGRGQVVLLSGEAGIGKSRLVQVLTEQAAAEVQAWLTPCQCSPYYQHSALYPMIDLLERVVLRFDREHTPPHKLGKLEGFLVQYGLPLPETVPLFATLLSLPLPADYAPLTVSPEQQKQQTLHALLTILLRSAAQQPVLFVMVYTHISDQHSVFHTQVIACSVREAIYVLDGLLNNDTVLRPKEHFVDQHGFTDQLFGLCHLLGFSLMPRLNVSKQTLYKVDRSTSYGRLDEVITGTVDTALIREQWDQLVRVAASLRNRTAPAHVVLQRLASSAPSDRLAKALTALGRALRSLYLLRYIQEEDLRARMQLQINRGEGRHQVARRLFFANQGAFQTGDYEEIMNKATCLSLLSNAALVWNTVQMSRIIEQLRASGETITQDELARISPMAFSHIIPNGTYFTQRPSVEHDGDRNGPSSPVSADMLLDIER